MALKAKDVGLDILEYLNVSERTILYYRELAEYFLKFMQENNYSFKQPVLLKYRQHLKNAPLKTNTRRSYFNAARMLCRLLYSTNRIRLDLTKDPLGRDIVGFRAGRQHVYGINQREVRKLKNHLDQLPPGFISARLKAIVALLLYQGLRQVEVHRLNVEDINFQAKQLCIKSKGKDYREIVHLHPRTTNALLDYCGYLNKTGPLFVGSRDKTKRLATPLGIHYIVKAKFKQLKIKRSVHGFRHYFTTQLIEHYKGDLAMVGMYTRHKNLNTLQVYNDKIIASKDLANYYAAIDKFH